MLKFLLVVIVFAAATYVVVRMLQGRGLNPSRSPQQVRKKRPRPSGPPKIIAPDDDEDFLRDLDRKRLNPEDPEG